MATPLQKLLRIASPAALFSLLLPACIDNNATLFIRQVQAPDPDSACTVPADPGSLAYGGGSLDVSLTSGYNAWVLVGNQLHSRGDNATQKVETSKVQLYEVEVEVFDFAGGTLGSYTMPTAGFVPEAAGITESYGLTRVVMVDPQISPAPGQTIISRVKVYGETLGGLEVETGWYDFPIYVCAGCLGCKCPESTDAEYYTACNPGNNEPVDCREPVTGCWNANDNFCGCPLN